VWYQNGTYPAAAGQWSAGQWYDGAVGSYDGIYQGITVTAGVTYTISFDALSTYQASSLQQAIIGVYAGACTSTTIAASLCVPNSSAGFTPIAQPNQTVNAGNASAPPVAPSAPSTPTVTGTTTTNSVTNSTSYGTTATVTTTALGTAATVIAIANARESQTSQALNVRQTATATTTTPVTYTAVATTPVTTTTTTTPVTVTTYSDGTSTTTNGTPVVTTNTANQVVTTTTTGNEVAVASESQNFSTRVDMYSQLSSVNSQVNSAFTSDPLSRTRIDEQGGLSLRNGKDTDVYIIGTGMQTNTINSYQATTGMIGVGADFIVDKDLLLGWQYGHANSTMTGDNAGGSLVKDMFGIYGVQSLDDWLVKFDLGYASNQYGSYHTLPQLGLSNSSTTNGNDYFGLARLYTPDAGKLDDVLSGLRAFVGQGYEHDYVGGVTEAGSALTAMSYDPTNTSTWTSEAGIAYYIKLDKDWSLGSELSMNNHDQKTELVSISYKTTDNSSVLLKAITQQTYSGVNNAVQAWARINF
jgi:hypothetical protein